MSNPTIKQVQIPNGVGGFTLYDIVDAGARELIDALGDAIYWIGVTTTVLTDGSTTNPITVEGESVTAKLGGMAQYDGEEFVWNGSAWQSIGKNNFGALAFANTAVGSFTPAGTISGGSASANNPTTATVNSITAVGTLPSFSVSNEILSLDPGTLPTKGTDQTVLTGIGAITVTDPTFTGTAGTVTVAPPANP